jgi:hypothetical protein
MVAGKRQTVEPFHRIGERSVGPNARSVDFHESWVGPNRPSVGLNGPFVGLNERSLAPEIGWDKSISDGVNLTKSSRAPWKSISLLVKGRHCSRVGSSAT